MLNRFILLILLVSLGACSPQPTPTGELPYSTDFNTAGQWTQMSNRQADIAVRDGRLHITVHQPETLVWSTAGLTLGDFTLEAEAEPLGGPDDNGYGLVARRVDDENLYAFQISGDGYFLIQKRAKGKWVNLTDDWQASPAIRPGRKTNHLRVACQGQRLTFVVNDTPLAQVTDGEFARGDIGVIASTFAEPGARVAFDNIQVKRGE